MSANAKFRLVTRSDFDGLVCAVLLKHLDMIQALIARMAGYGASFKSYCITVTTAVAGFAVAS